MVKWWRREENIRRGRGKQKARMIWNGINWLGGKVVGVVKTRKKKIFLGFRKVEYNETSPVCDL